MKKIINAAICDARKVTEESLVGFDQIKICAAVLIVGERSKELLNKYHARLDVANVLELPDGQDINVKMINGKFEIGPDADGTGIFLMINGKLIVTEGAQEAVKSFNRIMVNGKVLMPKSLKGQFANIQINGGTEYYPDGATILKADTQIDDLFLLRAVSKLYYCPGSLFFLDTALDTEKLLEKGLQFAARKIVIAESLLEKLILQFDETADIVRVPDGTALIDDDLELKPKTIRKYGPKLYVDGNVTIEDTEVIPALEYLYVDGNVSVRKGLEDAFDEVESVYDKLKVIDPDLGILSDRPIIKVGSAALKKYPSGVRVEDCAKVKILEDLSPEDIIAKLHISDCAVVVCSKEQEEAVNMISEDVAVIRVSEKPQGVARGAGGADGGSPDDGSPDGGGADSEDFNGADYNGADYNGEEDENGIDGLVDGILGGILGKHKGDQVINAAEYKM